MVPFTFEGVTYRLKFDSYRNGGQCIRVLHVSDLDTIGTLTMSKALSPQREQPLTQQQCLVRKALPFVLDGLIEALVEFQLLEPTPTVENPSLHEIHLPTLVNVFHNCNERFKIEGDPDQCVNLRPVATVTVPFDEKPLDWAFRSTNHIDFDWRANSHLLAQPGKHRSTGVGDVLEIQDYTDCLHRYILNHKGFINV